MRSKRPVLVIAFNSTAQVSAGCGLAWKAEVDEKQALLNALSKSELSYAACTVMEMFG